MSNESWAKEFESKREAQIALEEERHGLELERLKAAHKGPVIAAQVEEGTTLEAQAEAGDLAARTATVGANFTKPDPETGEYVPAFPTEEAPAGEDYDEDDEEEE